MAARGAGSLLVTSLLVAACATVLGIDERRGRDAGPAAGGSGTVDGSGGLGDAAAAGGAAGGGPGGSGGTTGTEECRQIITADACGDCVCAACLSEATVAACAGRTDCKPAFDCMRTAGCPSASACAAQGACAAEIASVADLLLIDELSTCAECLSACTPGGVGGTGPAGGAGGTGPVGGAGGATAGNCVNAHPGDGCWQCLCGCIQGGSADAECGTRWPECDAAVNCMRAKGCSNHPSCAAAGCPAAATVVAPAAFDHLGQCLANPACAPSCMGTGGSGGSGGTPSCTQVTCRGVVKQCGNCIDDDSDGRADSADPECTGPCDDLEDVFDMGVPGFPVCTADCYFDDNAGPGDDGCEWTYACDPLTPFESCPYNPSATIGARDCAALSGTSAVCNSQCGMVEGSLVPNGCDCFGCCENLTTAASGDYFWLGTPTCRSSTFNSCRPCTPVMSCFNACDPCEICVMRDRVLPTSCTGAPIQSCPPGRQQCGNLGVTQPPCPAGEYCLTGCCVKAP